MSHKPSIGFAVQTEAAQTYFNAAIMELGAATMIGDETLITRAREKAQSCFEALCDAKVAHVQSVMMTIKEDER